MCRYRSRGMVDGSIREAGKQAVKDVTTKRREAKREKDKKGEKEAEKDKVAREGGGREAGEQGGIGGH